MAKTDKKDRSLAMNRIDALFLQIEEMRPFKQEVADRYVKRAWQIATKNNSRMPITIKRRFCRKCKSYWRPGKNVRIRINKGKKTYTCLSCKAIKRVPLR